jgi:hypothetical protein
MILQFFELNANGSTASWSAMADWGGLLDDIAYGLAEDQNGKFVLAGSSGNTTLKHSHWQELTPTHL